MANYDLLLVSLVIMVSPIGAKLFQKRQHVIIWPVFVSSCLSRWLTAPAATASTTWGAGRCSAAPADSPLTSPAPPPWARPPAPSAAAASQRVCCRTPTCSAPAPLARWVRQAGCLTSSQGFTWKLRNNEVTVLPFSCLVPRLEAEWRAVPSCEPDPSLTFIKLTWSFV